VVSAFVWEEKLGDSCCGFPKPRRDGGRVLLKTKDGQYGFWYESSRFDKTKRRMILRRLAHWVLCMNLFSWNHFCYAKQQSFA